MAAYIASQGVLYDSHLLALDMSLDTSCKEPHSRACTSSGTTGAVVLAPWRHGQQPTFCASTVPPVAHGVIWVRLRCQHAGQALCTHTKDTLLQPSCSRTCDILVTTPSPPTVQVIVANDVPGDLSTAVAPEADATARCGSGPVQWVWHGPGPGPVHCVRHGPGPVHWVWQGPGTRQIGMKLHFRT